MVYSMLDFFTAVVCTKVGNSWCKVGHKTLRNPHTGTAPADQWPRTRALYFQKQTFLQLIREQQRLPSVCVHVLCVCGVGGGGGGREEGI